MKRILAIFTLITAFTLGLANATVKAEDDCGVNQCADCEVVIIDNEQWMICPVYDETGRRVGYKATRIKFGGGTTN